MSEPPVNSPVERLFNQAADLPLSERSAFLDAACHGDFGLRAEVEDLLACDESASPRNQLLDHPLLHRAGGNGGGNAPAFGPAAAHGEVGTLGPYRVVKLLGQGGMGAVYAALDPRLGRKLALKVMLPQFAADAAAKERFLREAHAAAQVSHDNVVTVYEADEREGLPYIAMQLLEGCTLDEQMRKSGAPLLPEILRIAREAADGLAAAHEIGLVHRDVKPNNLWLQTPTGRVKVLDFGLARPLDTQIAVTQTGAVIGTPAYMSPEQARGERLDHRTDLFSLGAVLYRLCSGRLPFEGPSTIAVLMALGMEDPPPLREINPSVPEPLAKLIHQMLAKKPEQRPGSAAEVARRLRLIQVGKEEESQDDAVLKSISGGGRRMVAAIAVAVAVLLLTGGAIWMSNGPAKQHEVGKRESTTATRPEVVIVANKPVPATVVASDRDAAEWVLAAGGSVEILGEQGEVANISDLKDGHHFLNSIDLHGRTDAVKNGALRNIQGLAHLTYINLSQTPVSDSDLIYLSQCAELKVVWLHETLVSGSGLVHLKSLSKLEELHLGNSKLDDDGMSQLCKLTSLQRVFIQSASVSPKGISCLANLPLLNHLDLYGSLSMDDESVVRLKDCRLLENLCLGSTRVSDKGLACLKDLPELKSLNLIFNKFITNKGLAHLRKGPHLIALDLFGTGVDDAGMETVASISTLKELDLDQTNVTDAGLADLLRLPSLNILHLNRLPGVTDQGLVQLEGLKRLSSIQLTNTGVTAAGLKRFRTALPECKIEQEDGAADPLGSAP